MKKLVALALSLVMLISAASTADRMPVPPMVEMPPITEAATAKVS